MVVLGPWACDDGFGPKDGGFEAPERVLGRRVLLSPPPEDGFEPPWMVLGLREGCGFGPLLGGFEVPGMVLGLGRVVLDPRGDGFGFSGGWFGGS